MAATDRRGAGATSRHPTTPHPTARHPTARHLTTPHPTDGPVLWLRGATAVGKSAVGFDAYLKALRAGPTAYADVDQLAHRGPTPADHRLRARNLAALWRNFRAAGARGLVVVGPLKDGAALAVYTAELPAAAITVCRLHAGHEQLTGRVLLRGRGVGWAQPGDPLRDRPVRELLEVAGRAAAEAEALERTAFGLRVDTDGRTAGEAADEVLSRSGRPGR